MNKFCAMEIFHPLHIVDQLETSSVPVLSDQV